MAWQNTEIAAFGSHTHHFDIRIVYWAVGSNDIDFNGLHAFTLLGPD